MNGKNIKVMLLAAGYGKRLGKLTKKNPKCLMPIGGVPLLGIWIKKLEALGCSEIIINTHYLADQVSNYINKFKSKIKIKVIYENKLLGTAGTLLENAKFFKEGDCLMIHADNYTNLDFNQFFKAHNNKKEGCLLSMVTFDSDNPYSCGIVDVDKNGIMIGFEEKPTSPKSNIANGAIYMFDNSLFDYLKKNRFKTSFNDFSKDVIPLLKNKVNTWHTNDYIIDIGTPEKLEIAMKLSNSKS